MRGASILRDSIAFVLVAIVIADAGRAADADLWGHILYGRSVLTQFRLTSPNYWSYSASLHPILTHEWMTETMMAWIYGHFGILGLKLWKFSLTSSTIVFLALIVAETGASAVIQLAVLITASVAIGPWMQIRPQLFDYVFMSALMWALTRRTFGRDAPIWLLIPGAALWANLHGGFVVGLAIFAVYAGVATGQDLLRGNGLSRGARLACVLVLAALATLINPFGVEVWKTIWGQMTNPITRHIIGDWLPLEQVLRMHAQAWGVAVTSYLLPLMMMAFTAAAIAYAPDSRDLPILAISVLLFVASFFVIRNLALAVIAMVEPLALHGSLAIAAFANRHGIEKRSGQRTSSRRGQLITATVAIAMAVETGLLSRHMRCTFEMPVGAVSFMQAHELQGNIMNNFEWGGFLEWHMGPQSRVFVDTRYDLAYPRGVIQDYITLTLGGQGSERVLSSYPHEFILLATIDGASRFLSERPEWVQIYRDRQSALYARANSPAARIPGIPIIGSVSPCYFP